MTLCIALIEKHDNLLHYKLRVYECTCTVYVQVPGYDTTGPVIGRLERRAM